MTEIEIDRKELARQMRAVSVALAPGIASGDGFIHEYAVQVYRDALDTPFLEDPHVEGSWGWWANRVADALIEARRE